MDSPIWLSTKQSAERCGVTIRTIYRFIDNGSLTAYKFGRVIRVKSTDIDKFIESCRLKSGAVRHLYQDETD